MATTVGAPGERMTRLREWYRHNERLILGLTGFLGFFLAWELGARTDVINSFFFSSPVAIAQAAVREVQQPRFWNDVYVSGSELFVGYFAAVALGIPLGLLAGWYRRFNYFIDAWLNFFNATPRIALLPLIILAVGIGPISKMIVVFLGVFFTVVINTITGVRTTDQRFIDVTTAFSASQRTVFMTVVLPGSLPFILAGLRLGIGRGLIGVLVGELYAANAGLGYMITVASQTLQTDRLFVGVIVFTLLGVGLVELLRHVEKRVHRWRPARQEVP